MLVKRCLDKRVDRVHVGAESWFNVADIAVSSRFVVVYAPKDQGERVDFFQQLGLFLVDSSRL